MFELLQVPALDGAAQGYAALEGAMGYLHRHATTLLLGVGVGAASASVLAWILVGMGIIGATWKFKTALLWLFMFVVIFTMVSGLGVKLGG